MIRLTDEQWECIRKHFPEEHIADGRPGRKPVPTRRVLEAVLWILNTGAQWHMLPQSYPNYKTVHRRFQNWCHNEVLRRVLTDVANELRETGALDEEECFIDATFAMAKGGGAEIGPTRRGKGLKIMEGIKLPTALALLLRADLRGPAKRERECLLQCWLALDLAADVADDPAQPATQDTQLPLMPLELFGMSVTSRHHCCGLGDARIGLP